MSTLLPPEGEPQRVRFQLAAAGRLAVTLRALAIATVATIIRRIHFIGEHAPPVTRLLTMFRLRRNVASIRALCQTRAYTKDSHPSELASAMNAAKVNRCVLSPSYNSVFTVLGEAWIRCVGQTERKRQSFAPGSPGSRRLARRGLSPTSHYHQNLTPVFFRTRSTTTNTRAFSSR